MAINVLHDHSTLLLSCLQAAYWEEPKFLSFKKELEQLIEGLLGYQNYLQSQSKKMKLRVIYPWKGNQNKCVTNIYSIASS